MLLFALVLTVNVERSIKMDTLENEIKIVKDNVSQMKPMLLVLHRSVIDVDRNQECLEHEVFVCKQCSTDLEKRLCALEEYVNAMGQNLNGAIDRINDLHQTLEELKNDLEYDEEFGLEDKDMECQTEGKIKKQ